MKSNPASARMNKTDCGRLLLACVPWLVMILVGALPVHAQTAIWTKSGNGLWSDPLNWSSPPWLMDSPRDIVFNIANSYTVDSALSLVDIGSLRVQAGDVRLKWPESGGNWHMSVQQLDINPNATLRIRDAEMVIDATGFSQYDPEYTSWLRDGSRLYLENGGVRLATGRIRYAGSPLIEGHGYIWANSILKGRSFDDTGGYLDDGWLTVRSSGGNLEIKTSSLDADLIVANGTKLMLNHPAASARVEIGGVVTLEGGELSSNSGLILGGLVGNGILRTSGSFHDIIGGGIQATGNLGTLSDTLAVGIDRVELVSTSTPVLAAGVTMDGGFLHSEHGLSMEPGAKIFGRGAITSNLPFTDQTWFLPSGYFSYNPGDARPGYRHIFLLGDNVSIDSHLSLGSLSPVAPGSVSTLDRMVIGPNGKISGFGEVDAQVTGTGEIHAMGSGLTLGRANANSGVDFSGLVRVAIDSQLTLLDKDYAVLGGTIGTFDDFGFGTIEAINGVEINGTLYYGGTINAPVRGQGTIDLRPTGHEYGRTTLLGDASSNSGFDFHGNVHVGTAELVLRDADAAVLRGDLTLTTHGTNPEVFGRVSALNGLEVVGSISGSGAINAPITGSGVINATGSLVLGTTSGSSGFDFAGTLNAGGSHVTLLTPGLPARLGVLTAISGGRLQSANGFVTDPGDQLVGFGVVQGAFFGGLGSAAMAPTATLVYTSELLLGLSETWILSDGDATFAAPISMEGATVRGFGGGLALTAAGSISGHGHLLLPLFTSARPITVAGGTLDLGAGGRLAGTINAPAGTVLQLSGGVTQFQLGVNAQVDRLRLNGGSAIVEASSGFAASKIEVEAGSLTFGSGTTGNLTNTSALTVGGTGTATLETPGSLVMPASTTITGDGTNRGTLTGSGTWILSGGNMLEVNRGALGGSGMLSVQPNAQVLFSGGGNLDRDITNYGLVRFNGSNGVGYFNLHGEATLTNASGGALRFADTFSLPSNYFELFGLTINNAGLMGIAVAPPTELPNYAKPTVRLYRDLDNSGTIDLRNDAKLEVFGNFSNTGTVTMGDNTISHLVASGGGAANRHFCLGHSTWLSGRASRLAGRA